VVIGSHVGARLLFSVLQAGWGHFWKWCPVQSPCLACFQEGFVCFLHALICLCIRAFCAPSSVYQRWLVAWTTSCAAGARQECVASLLCCCCPCPSTSLRSAYLAVWRGWIQGPGAPLIRLCPALDSLVGVFPVFFGGAEFSACTCYGICPSASQNVGCVVHQPILAGNSRSSRRQVCGVQSKAFFVFACLAFACCGRVVWLTA
jgi:hypothetical protein